MTTPSPDGAVAPAIPSDAYRVDGAAVAHALVEGLDSIRRTDALLLRSEAACLAFIADGSRARILGAPSVGHVADDLLRIGRRAASERIALHRTLSACPEAEEAFLAGRLSACQILAIAPLLRRTEGDHSTLLEEAEGIPVRTLRARARAFLARRHETPSPGEEDPDGAQFSFSAPLPFLSVWRDTMDLARRVLGYDAPQYRCIEAILAETGMSDGSAVRDEVSAAETDVDGAEGIETVHGPGEVSAGAVAPSRTTPQNIAPSRLPSPLPSRPNALSHRVLLVRPADMAFAHETLSLLHAHIDDVRDIFEPGSPSDSFDALDRLRQLQALHAPLRILLARILRSIRDMRAHTHLDYRSLRDLVESRLDLSERSGRALVQESHLFENSPAIEDAYGRGQIGIGKAFLVHGIAAPERTDEFVERARAVTLAQFRREYHFLEMFRLTVPSIAARFPGPLPQPGLDDALIKALCDSHGWTRERIDRELARRGLAPTGDSVDTSGREKSTVDQTEVAAGREESTPDQAKEAAGRGRCNLDLSSDPAANRTLMERLEILLDLLVQSRWDDPPATGDTLPDGERQMFAHLNGTVPIRFWAPDSVIADLKAAIARIRQEYDPALPIWMAMTVLFAAVDKEWNRHDPESRPTQGKILRRDNHRCQSPLCGSRSHLEVHHIDFVSHGGSNTPPNLTTVCHGDHRYVIHAGHARLVGSAPGALRWELGLRPGRPPLLIVLGHRILGGLCA